MAYLAILNILVYFMGAFHIGQHIGKNAPRKFLYFNQFGFGANLAFTEFYEPNKYGMMILVGILSKIPTQWQKINFFHDERTKLGK